ncbi:hypothetical protein HDU85_001636 [Gaertneriomyces sp. JEL0708]|nr:hypothetical protein HDU85_001636 [Gaertneriomyces sp. JEL0708]
MVNVLKAKDSGEVPRALNPTQKEEAAFFARIRGNLYGGAGVFATRCILRRIDAQMTNGNLTYKKWDTVHIEHIYRQNPGLGWVTSVKQPHPTATRNCLGNLCLLPDDTNYKCSNSPWTYKRGIYIDHGNGIVPFAITFKDGDMRTKETIEARYKDLLERIEKIYDVKFKDKHVDTAAQGAPQGQTTGDQEDLDEEDLLIKTAPEDVSTMSATEKYDAEEREDEEDAADAQDQPPKNRKFNIQLWRRVLRVLRVLRDLGPLQ